MSDMNNGLGIEGNEMMMREHEYNARRMEYELT